MPHGHTCSGFFPQIRYFILKHNLSLRSPGVENKLSTMETLFGKPRPLQVTADHGFEINTLNHAPFVLMIFFKHPFVYCCLYITHSRAPAYYFNRLM